MDNFLKYGEQESINFLEVMEWAYKLPLIGLGEVVPVGQRNIANLKQVLDNFSLKYPDENFWKSMYQDTCIEMYTYKENTPIYLNPNWLRKVNCSVDELFQQDIFCMFRRSKFSEKSSLKIIEQAISQSESFKPPIKDVYVQARETDSILRLSYKCISSVSFKESGTTLGYIVALDITPVHDPIEISEIVWN